MATKKYYAAYHYYGINICNDYETLYRFPTMAARDKFVDDDEWDYNYHLESLTRDEARHHFPEAFRMVGNFHEESDERDWLACSDNPTCEYWHRNNYYDKMLF